MKPSLAAGLPILAVGICAACAESGSGPRPEVGGTAVVAGSHDLQAMNGLVVDEQETADLLKNALFMTLVRLDSQLEYEPYLARRWSMEADTAVRLVLRSDVRWHDGTPTTAHDVAFTFRSVKDPEVGSGMSWLFEPWREVEVVDDTTLRFLIRPHPDPLYPWTELPIVPAHLLDTVPAARMRTAPFNVAPVGNGPFRFVSHRENDRWVFEANLDFPEPLGGRPNIDRLIWRSVPESSAQVAELLTGNAHLAMSPRSVHLTRLRSAADADVLIAPSTSYAFVGWNAAGPPLDDARVRRALTRAIDRQGLLDGLRDGHGTVAIGPVPPAHWAHHPDLSPLPHDTAAAAAALDSAGWRDRNGDGVRENAQGELLEITLKIPAGVDFSRDVAEVVRGDLAEVGVRLRTQPLEPATLFADITGETKRFDAVLLTLAGDFRLDLRDTFHSRALGQPYQLSSWASPESDRLMDLIAEADTREEALPRWYRLQEVLAEEQPWTFLYYAPLIRARHRRLKGVEVDARGTFVTLPSWWLDPDGPPTPGGEAAPAAPAPDAPGPDAPR